jgi:hypothetical protein
MWRVTQKHVFFFKKEGCSVHVHPEILHKFNKHMKGLDWTRSHLAWLSLLILRVSVKSRLSPGSSCHCYGRSQSWARFSGFSMGFTKLCFVVVSDLYQLKFIYEIQFRTAEAQLAVWVGEWTEKLRSEIG